MSDDRPQELPPQHQARQPGREHEMDPPPRYEADFYHGSGKLDGRAALITGGDSGIGRAVAVLFAREGADVAIVYLDEEKDAEETKRLVESEGGRCLLLPGDVGDRDFCREAVERTVEAFGRLDVLVPNAAVQFVREDITEIDEDQLVHTFRTNVFSKFFLIQAALPHLGEGASIINTASVTAYRGNAVLIDYSATKGAIVSLTRALSQNLAPRGIRVNAVAPGPIWTPLIPASFSAEQVAEFGTDVPLGRPGQPEEVAPAYVYLAAEDSSYMTGQVLHPNGGKIVGG